MTFEGRLRGSEQFVLRRNNTMTSYFTQTVSQKSFIPLSYTSSSNLAIRLGQVTTPTPNTTPWIEPAASWRLNYVCIGQHCSVESGTVYQALSGTIDVPSLQPAEQCGWSIAPPQNTWPSASSVPLVNTAPVNLAISFPTFSSLFQVANAVLWLVVTPISQPGTVLWNSNWTNYTARRPMLIPISAAGLEQGVRLSYFTTAMLDPGNFQNSVPFQMNYNVIRGTCTSPSNPGSILTATSGTLLSDPDGIGAAHSPPSGANCTWEIRCPVDYGFTAEYWLPYNFQGQLWMAAKDPVTGESTVFLTRTSSYTSARQLASHISRYVVISFIGYAPPDSQPQAWNSNSGMNLTYQCMPHQCGSPNATGSQYSGNGTITSGPTNAVRRPNGEVCDWIITCPTNMTYINVKLIPLSTYSTDKMFFSDPETGEVINTLSGYSYNRDVDLGFRTSIAISFVAAGGTTRASYYTLEYTCQPYICASQNVTNSTFIGPSGSVLTRPTLSPLEQICDWGLTCPPGYNSMMVLGNVTRNYGDAMSIGTTSIAYSSVFQLVYGPYPVTVVSPFPVLPVSYTATGRYETSALTLYFQCFNQVAGSSTLMCYESNHKQRLYTALQGTIMSDVDGVGPFRVPTHSDCSYNVTCPLNMRVKVVDIESQFYYSTALKAYDGDTFKSDVLLTTPYDGLVYNTHAVRFQMLTGTYQSTTRPNDGFTIHYQCVPKSCESQNANNETHYSSRGTIMSDSDGVGPINYAPDQTCRWYIQCPVGQIFTVSLLALRTEYNYDTLRIIDRNSGGYILTTSSYYNSGFYTTSNAVAIYFSSDGSSHSDGFTLDYYCRVPTCSSINGTGVTFNSQSGTVLTDIDGAITTERYTANENCTWKVRCPQPFTKMYLFFYARLSTAGSLVFRNATGEIIDITAKTLTQEAIYDTSTLDVSFTSDSIISYGATWEWRCVTTRCYTDTSFIHRGPSGVVQSDTDGSGAVNYRSGENCIWTIDCGSMQEVILTRYIGELRSGDYVRVAPVGAPQKILWESTGYSYQYTISVSTGVSAVNVEFNSLPTSSTWDGFSLSYECAATTAVPVLSTFAPSQPPTTRAPATTTYAPPPSPAPQPPTTTSPGTDTLACPNSFSIDGALGWYKPTNVRARVTCRQAIHCLAGWVVTMGINQLSSGVSLEIRTDLGQVLSWSDSAQQSASVPLIGQPRNATIVSQVTTAGIAYQVLNLSYACVRQDSLTPKPPSPPSTASPSGESGSCRMNSSSLTPTPTGGVLQAVNVTVPTNQASCSWTLECPSGMILSQYRMMTTAAVFALRLPFSNSILSGIREIDNRTTNVASTFQLPLFMLSLLNASSAPNTWAAYSMTFEYICAPRVTTVPATTTAQPSTTTTTAPSPQAQCVVTDANTQPDQMHGLVSYRGFVAPNSVADQCTLLLDCPRSTDALFVQAYTQASAFGTGQQSVSVTAPSSVLIVGSGGTSATGAFNFGTAAATVTMQYYAKGAYNSNEPETTLGVRFTCFSQSTPVSNVLSVASTSDSRQLLLGGLNSDPIVWVLSCGARYVEISSISGTCAASVEMYDRIAGTSIYSYVGGGIAPTGPLPSGRYVSVLVRVGRGSPSGCPNFDVRFACRANATGPAPTPAPTPAPDAGRAATDEQVAASSNSGFIIGISLGLVVALIAVIVAVIIAAVIVRRRRARKRRMAYEGRAGLDTPPPQPGSMNYEDFTNAGAGAPSSQAMTDIQNASPAANVEDDLGLGYRRSASPIQGVVINAGLAGVDASPSNGRDFVDPPPQKLVGSSSKYHENEDAKRPSSPPQVEFTPPEGEVRPERPRDAGGENEAGLNDIEFVLE